MTSDDSVTAGIATGTAACLAAGAAAAPEIRLATGADLAGVVDLDAVCFGSAAWSAGSWADEFDRPDRVIQVAGPDASIAGYVVSSVPADVHDTVDLTRIAVALAWRRTGLGARLLRAALRSVPGRQVLLEVAESNDAARALYRRAGFTVIGRRRGYYGAVDALVMRSGSMFDD